jgi:hypothetical protein
MREKIAFRFYVRFLDVAFAPRSPRCHAPAGLAHAPKASRSWDHTAPMGMHRSTGAVNLPTHRSERLRGRGRLSSGGRATDQDLDIQVAALKQEGCTRIRSEKRSGTSTANREELRTVLDFLRKGDVLMVSRIDRLAHSIEPADRFSHDASATATLHWCPGSHWCDDPLEIGLRPRIAVDRHMLRNVEVQPLDVAEQHDRVLADVRQIRSLRWRRIEIGIHQYLRLRKIGHQHVGCVVEAVYVVELDRPRLIADCVVVRERERPWAGLGETGTATAGRS